MNSVLNPSTAHTSISSRLLAIGQVMTCAMRSMTPGCVVNSAGSLCRRWTQGYVRPFPGMWTTGPGGSDCRYDMPEIGLGSRLPARERERTFLDDKPSAQAAKRCNPCGWDWGTTLSDHGRRQQAASTRL